MASRHPQGVASALTCFGFACPQITQTFTRSRLSIGSIIEYLDRYPARITAVAQSAQDRYKIDLSEPRSAAIGVVGVKMAGAPGIATNQIGDWRIFSRHRFDIKVEQKIRMRQAIEDLHGLGASIDEVGLGRCQRFQAQLDAVVGDSVLCPAERIESIIDCLSATGPDGDASLGRRAKHQHLAAKI